MSEVMWGINFITLNSIGEADRADKLEAGLLHIKLPLRLLTFGMVQGVL